MARKKKEEAPENQERWLVSYADVITLLFAFFVVMYSISEVNAKKLKRVGSSFQAAFNFIGLAGQGKASIFPAEQKQQAVSLPLGEKAAGRGEGEGGYDVILAQIQNEIFKTLREEIQVRKIRDLARLRVDERGLVVSLAASEFYRPGETTLVPNLVPVVDKLAEILKPLKIPIRIEGHTDNTPVLTKAYPSNWDLSTARAVNLVRYLSERSGIDPRRLSAAGYGEFRPLVSNDSEEGRGMNRRVDIVILNIRENHVEPSPYGFDPTASTVLDKETGRGLTEISGPTKSKD
ncbi:MAG: OmpA family protein [Candidatus Tectomicrobia bacterium]|uniref:OmpA family protein n=1 Tax=Tectimicrobiota bacterium TaxID=2528274 RepID=A0A932GP50_UNCTE|nr:OmpA family protein [Candidatus Tectomicrobia bacterium]